MPRFYAEPEAFARDPITLSEAESHHCVEVLRLKPGARVTVFNGCSAAAECVIETAGKRLVTVRVLRRSQSPALPCAITLAQVIPKGKNMELIVQKAVELGAARIAPLISERAVVRLGPGEADRKRRKWRQTALEACKQCGQNLLPEVLAPMPLKTYLEAAAAPELALVGSLQPGAEGIKQTLRGHEERHGKAPGSVTMFIGPEGDFTPDEITTVIDAGVRPVTLGPIILRTETAALYALSVLAHELFPTTSPQ